MQFRLVTYNIHKAIGGVDRRYDLDRVIEVLAHYAPDIVFLQEVDDGVPRSRHHRQVDMLAEALNLPHHVYQRNVTLTEGHYGNAILSRTSLFEISHIDLKVPLKKHRRAIACRTTLRDEHRRTVNLVNCHLGLAGFERQVQLKRILGAPAVMHLRSSSPLIVGGDYNDVWGTLGPKIMQPAGFSSVGRSLKTFPAVLPVRALDKVFYRGALALERGFAAHIALARQASDHLPVVADFKIRE